MTRNAGWKHGVCGRMAGSRLFKGFETRNGRNIRLLLHSTRRLKHNYDRRDQLGEKWINPVNKRVILFTITMENCNNREERTLPWRDDCSRAAILPSMHALRAKFTSTERKTSAKGSELTRFAPQTQITDKMSNVMANFAFTKAKTSPHGEMTELRDGEPKAAGSFLHEPHGVLTRKWRRPRGLQIR